ncbi:type I methionyl aminopeptidase, partial [Bacillus velezensis]
NSGSGYVTSLGFNLKVFKVDVNMCAHFLHSIAITETGFDILTKV